MEKKDEEEPEEKTTEEITAEANAAAERLEEANKKKAELLAREEALKALSGNAEAGQAPPEKKEETPKEYKDRVMKGEV